MYGLTLLSLALASSSLVSSAALKPRVLAADDVIVFGNGQHAIVKLADYMAELAKTNTSIGRPDLDFVDIPSINDTLPGALEKRCTKVNTFKRYADQDFLDWDVPMSSAVHAVGTTDTISVSDGYSIQDSITVSSSVDFTIVENYLSASVGISYTSAWSSSYAAAYTTQIPAGQWGMMVSNPRVYRRSGTVKSGCIGSQTTGTFSADQHFSNSYNGLAWVQGSISLCTSSSYPIKKCIGDGYNY